MKETKEKTGSAGLVRKGVFIPAFVIMAIVVAIGFINNEGLAKGAKAFFGFSLGKFGWLYQLVAVVSVVVIAIVTCSKLGDMRIGGANAKPKYPFGTWFAMILTGGIAVGIVNWGINEPLIYYGNVYGELDQLGIQAGTQEAARFALGRCFYNWTFVPYAMYAVSGLLIAYMYFNKKEKLSVISTLKPLFGKKTENPIFMNTVDTLCSLAITLGMSSGLGTGLALLISGLNVVYKIPNNTFIWVLLGGIATLIFTSSAILGVDKGIRRLASLNSKIFYGLLIFLFITGPMAIILSNSVSGLGEWLNNFFIWGLDSGDVGGEALTRWWTLADWCSWIAYAPIMGIFLGKIAYGRTVREFMIINWVMPSLFGIVWFSVWGGTGLNWQMNGVVDMVGVIKESGATAGVWAFLQNLPLGLGIIIIPVVMITLMLSFSTAADSMTSTIASICTKGQNMEEEPPKSQKLIWGILIGSSSCIMGAVAGGVRGIDGVKQLASVGGFLVLFVFLLQLIAFIKTFFVDLKKEKNGKKE